MKRLPRSQLTHASGEMKMVDNEGGNNDTQDPTGPVCQQNRGQGIDAGVSQKQSTEQQIAFFA